MQPQEILTAPDRPCPPRPRHVPVPPRRAFAVIVAAEVAAVAAWGVARLAGVDLLAERGQELQAVTAGDVVVATLVAGLAAWGVRELLRRWGRATAWPFTGSTLLAVSGAGPAYQADGASAVALMGLHLVVGAVLIAGLTRAGARP